MRKVINFTAEDGRDKGKVFVITEMPASQAEKWALKIILAIGNTGVPVPDKIMEMGVSGILLLGLASFQNISFRDAEPILDEMMGCVAIMPDPSKPAVVRALVEDDIEEISTRLKLRKEVLNTNLGFFDNAAA